MDGSRPLIAGNYNPVLAWKNVILDHIFRAKGPDQPPYRPPSSSGSEEIVAVQPHFGQSSLVLLALAIQTPFGIFARANNFIHAFS